MREHPSVRGTFLCTRVAYLSDVSSNFLVGMPSSSASPSRLRTSLPRAFRPLRNGGLNGVFGKRVLCNGVMAEGVLALMQGEGDLPHQVKQRAYHALPCAFALRMYDRNKQ